LIGVDEATKRWAICVVMRVAEWKNSARYDDRFVANLLRQLEIK
jgi:hypothetical protein